MWSDSEKLLINLPVVEARQAVRAVIFVIFVIRLKVSMANRRLYSGVSGGLFRRSRMNLSEELLVSWFHACDSR